MWPSDFIPSLQTRAPDGPHLCFIFIGDELLVTPECQLPAASQLHDLGAFPADLVIGSLGELPCRAIHWPETKPLPAGLLATHLRQLWGILSDDLYGIAARAKQMLWWDMHTRFCGVCGTATAPMENEPAKLCPKCGERAYPRLSPAMMVLIHRGNELLLARAPHFRSAMYSALAGFVEAGETVEACVHREVAEEVGLKITNLRWFASQSWPFPHSLMLAFHADYVSGEIVPQPGEIEDARWFNKEALPELPSMASIAGRLIEDALRRV